MCLKFSLKQQQKTFHDLDKYKFWKKVKFWIVALFVSGWAGSLRNSIVCFAYFHFTICDGEDSADADHHINKW